MTVLKYCFIAIYAFSLSLNTLCAQDFALVKNKKGFVFNIQWGGLFYKPINRPLEVDISANVDYSLRTSIGYPITPSLAVGFLTGLDEYPTTVLLPLGFFADGVLGKRKVKWYYRMVMGHSVPTSKTTNEKAYEGGSFINFDTGINIQTTLKGSLLIIVGYQRQSASETLKNVFRYPAYGDLLQEYSFKRVAFSVGYRVNL